MSYRDETVLLPMTTKTYSTHARAIVYGGCRRPAPVRMPNGSMRWVALPFWRSAGGIYSYEIKGE